MCRFARELND